MMHAFFMQNFLHSPEYIQNCTEYQAQKPGHRVSALENAFAYVRFTRYDVRFINNVRVAQIFFGSLMYAD